MADSGGIAANTNTILNLQVVGTTEFVLPSWYNESKRTYPVYLQLHRNEMNIKKSTSPENYSTMIKTPRTKCCKKTQCHYRGPAVLKWWSTAADLKLHISTQKNS